MGSRRHHLRRPETAGPNPGRLKGSARERKRNLLRVAVSPQFQTQDVGLIWVPRFSLPLPELGRQPSQSLAVPKFQIPPPPYCPPASLQPNCYHPERAL